MFLFVIFRDGNRVYLVLCHAWVLGLGLGLVIVLFLVVVGVVVA